MKPVQFSFNDILASTIHDLKNSLSMMLSSVNSVVEELDSQPDTELGRHNAIIQYEASRVNNGLMQLLALYKMDQGKLLFQPAYHNIYDFLEELVLSHAPLLEAKGFSWSIDADESLQAIFDDTLLAMALGNIVGNTIRYAHQEIRVQASCSEQGVTISINDDGPGYPGPMLEHVEAYADTIDQSTGSTGLGLYFAAQIAALHRHGERVGKIALSNGGELGGGLFSLTIP